MAELARRPLVLPGREHGLRRIIDDACQPQNLELNVVAEIESLSSVKRATEAGIGNTILPLGSVAEEVTQGRLRTTEIHTPRMSRRVVCTINTTRPTSVAAAAVVQLVHEVTHQMVASGAWPARWVGEVPLAIRSDG